MSLPADTAASHKTSELTPTKWTSGDFTLISSDNHIFKVDSYYLQAASSVFRHDTHVDIAIKRIEFTDDTLETALIIGHFLDLITTGKLEENLGRSTHLEKEFGDAPDWEYNTAMLYDLCNFLIKYDCLREISSLLGHVSLCILKNELDALSGFLLASIADQRAECVAFLNAHEADPDVWENGAHDRQTNRDISNGAVLDPRVMPFAFWRRIPNEYLWALTQAWDIHTKDKSRKIATEFDGLIEMLKSGTADSRTVTFTDDNLETFLIIGHFLYLITSGILPEWLGAAGRFEAEFGVGEDHRWEHETAILYDLCTFLIKYDCPKEVNALLNHALFRAMKGKLRFLSGFVLASIADKPAHCVAFLAADAKQPQFWGDFTPVLNVHRSITGRPLMDPRAMPVAWYRRIPGDYQWALTRAWDIHTTNPSFAVAAEFEDIMKHLKKKT